MNCNGAEHNLRTIELTLVQETYQLLFNPKINHLYFLIVVEHVHLINFGVYIVNDIDQQYLDKLYKEGLFYFGIRVNFILELLFFSKLKSPFLQRILNQIPEKDTLESFMTKKIMEFTKSFFLSLFQWRSFKSLGDYDLAIRH